MSVKIISDSSCDLWSLDGVNFDTVPLTISTEERTFIDDENLNKDELLSYLKKYDGRSYTACPGIQDWLDKFKGADEIYVVTMTSALSGTYNSACMAKEIYLEENPNAKVAIFDTLSTSAGQILFIENIVSMLKDQLSFEEICEEAPKFVDNSSVFFAFMSLHNLAENGRVKKIVAGAVGALGLSILGSKTPEGTLTTTGKSRGEKKTIVSLYDMILKAGYCGGKIRISHVNNPDLALHFEEFVKNHFPAADVKIHSARGLISYYGEDKGVIIGIDTLPPASYDSAGLLA